MPRSTTATISEGRNGDSPPGAFRIRLDENLDGLFAGMNLDTNRRVAKFNLVASPVFSSNYDVGHWVWAFRDQWRRLGEAAGKWRIEDVSSHFTSISQG
jgi:hypothetical protein